MARTHNLSQITDNSEMREALAFMLREDHRASVGAPLAARRIRRQLLKQKLAWAVSQHEASEEAHADG